MTPKRSLESADIALHSPQMILFVLSAQAVARTRSDKPKPSHQAITEKEPSKRRPQTISLVVEYRQAFGQRGVKADVLGRQR